MNGSDKLIIWHDSHIQGIELAIATSAKHCFPKHFHAAYEFSYLQNGLGSVYCKGEKNTIGKGQMAFFHPGEDYILQTI